MCKSLGIPVFTGMNISSILVSRKKNQTNTTPKKTTTKKPHQNSKHNKGSEKMEDQKVKVTILSLRGELPS